MSERLIEVENLGKKFCRDLKKSLRYAAQDSLADLLRLSSADRTHRCRPGEFWANHDISFSVNRGECIGLIGGNGAGKTTLLKLLCGLIKPDTGVINIRGQVGALIALGAGFNPILTGRENIFVYGSILGLTKKQTQQKLDEIVDFAEIPQAIDAPVRTYSSGMVVRLGFSTAVKLLKPDILILDEVLAVGDLGFRRKCYAAVDQLLDKAAVIFVSHEMNHIQKMCNQALFLENGTGTPSSVREGVTKYYQSQERNRITTLCGDLYHPVQSLDVKHSSSTIASGATFKAEIEINTSEPIANPCVVLAIYNNCEEIVGQWNSDLDGVRIDLSQGQNKVRFVINDLHLSAQRYRVVMNLVKRQSVCCLVSELEIGTFTVSTKAHPEQLGVNFVNANISIES